MNNPAETAALTQIHRDSRWRTLSLAEAVGASGRVIGGPFGSDLVQSDYQQSGVPVIRVTNQEGARVGGEFVFVSEEKADRLKANIAYPTDIIVVQRGSTVGKVSRIEPGGEYSRYVVCQSQMAVTVDPTAANPDYIFHFLRSPAFERYVAKSAIQTGQPHINLEILRAAPIKLPALPEQARIAQVLGNWDEAIDAASCLADAKRRRVAGVSEALLAPTHSFGSRPSGWTSATLGAVFSERQDRNDGLTDADVVTVGKYRIGKQSDHFTRSVASKDLSPYWTISPGDFVYDPMSAYYGALGRYDAHGDGLVSPAYRVIRLNPSVASDFMVHLLRSQYVRFQLDAQSSQGNKMGKRRSLQRSAFDSIEFFMPPLEEQVRISRVIGDFATDVGKTELYRDALQRQKRGLMQRLLTGERRTPERGGSR